MPLRSTLRLAGMAAMMAGALAAILVLPPPVARAAATSATRSVTDYGVKGDGATVETSLIQGAIDACAVDGGCTLRFPAGRYVSGTLYFRDNITLELAPGAVLAASTRAKDYTAPALLYAKGVNAIALTGDGEIQAGPVPAADETTARNPGSRLLSLLLVENATNVRISGIRFLRSPAWTITLHVVDGAAIDGVMIENAALAPSAGGVVLDSASHVSVRGLNFRGGGDGLVLQTSLVDGISPACQGITVSDSTFRSASMAIRIGDRSFGDIRNVTVSNSVIEASQGGIGVFMRDGGLIESLLFSNLVIETASLHPERAEWPLVLDLKRRNAEARAGGIEGVLFSGLRVRTAGKLLFSGMTSHPIRDLHLEGVSIAMRTPTKAPVEVSRPWKSPVDAVAGEDEMATALLFGYISASSVKDLRVTWDTSDGSEDRHAFFVHSADGFSLSGITARQGKVGGNRATMHFLSARNIEIRNSTAPPQTGIWVEAQGLQKQDFFFSGNNTSNAYRDVVYTK